MSHKSNLYRHRRTHEFAQLTYSGYGTVTIKKANGKEYSLMGSMFELRYEHVPRPNKLTRAYIRAKVGA